MLTREGGRERERQREREKQTERERARQVIMRHTYTHKHTQTHTNRLGMRRRSCSRAGKDGYFVRNTSVNNLHK